MANRVFNVGLIVNAAGNITNFVNNASNAADILRNRLATVGLQRQALESVHQMRQALAGATQRAQELDAQTGKVRAQFEHSARIVTTLKQKLRLASDAGTGIAVNIARIKPELAQAETAAAQLQRRLAINERNLAGWSNSAANLRERMKQTQVASVAAVAEVTKLEGKLAGSATLAQKLGDKLTATRAQAAGNVAEVNKLEAALQRAQKLQTDAGAQLANRLQQRLVALKNGAMTEVAGLENALKRAQSLHNGGDLAQRLQQRLDAARQLPGAKEALQRAEQLSGGLAKKLEEARAKSQALAAEMNHCAGALAGAEQRSKELGSKVDGLRTKLQSATDHADKLRAKLAQAEQKGAANRSGTERLNAQLQRAEKLADQFKNRLGDATRQSEGMRREVERTEQALRRANERAAQLRLNLNGPADAGRLLAANERSLAYGVAGRALQDSGSQFRSQGYAGLVGTAVMGYGTARASNPYIGFEDSRRDIAITGNLGEQDEGTVGALVRKASLDNNQRHQDLMTGVQVMVANGMSPIDAKTYVPLLAKTATATRGEMKDMANLIFTLSNTMEIKGEKQMEEALESIAVAGKAGSFEFRHMARYFPMLAAQMKSFGATGISTVRELSAMMQAARKTTGTAEEAAANTSNWFSHMAAPHTIKMYREAGIDYRAVLLKKMNDGRGISAPAASLEIADQFLDKISAGKMVEMTTKKGKVKERMNFKKALIEAEQGGITDSVKSVVERFGMGMIFNDMQVTNFLNGQRQNRQLMDAILAEQRSEASKGVNDRDFIKRMNTTREQLKAMRIGVHDLLIGVGEAVMNARHKNIEISSDSRHFIPPPVSDDDAPWAKIEQRRNDESRPYDSWDQILNSRSKEALAKPVEEEKSFGIIAQGYINSVSQFVEANQVMVRNVLMVGAGLAALSVTVMSTKFLAGGAMSVGGGAMRLWGWLRGKKTGHDVQRVYVVNMGSDGPGLPEGRGPRGRLSRMGRRVRLIASRGMQNVGNLVRTGASSLLARGVAMLPRVGGLLSGVGGALRVAAPFAMHLVRALLMAMGPVGWAIGAVSALAYAGYKLYKNWDTVGPMLGRAWGTIKSVVGAGWEWYTSLPGKFLRAGADLVNGFVEGIKSRMAAVGDVMIGMGASALTSVKNVLGIKSPSREMMKVGGFVAEGAALGMDARTALVTQSASRMGSALLNAATPRGQALANWAGQGAAVGHAGAPVINLTYAPVIHVQGGDAGALQAQLAQVLREDKGMLMREVEVILRRLIADETRRRLN